jgi:hypothetical protein
MDGPFTSVDLELTATPPRLPLHQEIGSAFCVQIRRPEPVQHPWGCANCSRRLRNRPFAPTLSSRHVSLSRIARAFFEVLKVAAAHERLANARHNFQHRHRSA